MKAAVARTAFSAPTGTTELRTLGLTDGTISRELGLVPVVISISVIKKTLKRKGPVCHVFITLASYRVIYHGKFLFKY